MQLTHLKERNHNSSEYKTKHHLLNKTAAAESLHLSLPYETSKDINHMRENSD